MNLKLARDTQQRLNQRLQGKEQPITGAEISDLIAEIEESLATPTAQTVADRLASIVSPDNPLQEIAGLCTMLRRLQRLTVALEQVQESGFHAVVVDWQRQPLRPALAAYHLTLWNYLVVRRDSGQAAAWN